MLNEIFQSIILGIAQGLGEFLPISSTAHLIILPKFFGWSDPGLAFDVALHLGTLLAVLAYFWKDWLEIIFNAKNSLEKKIPRGNSSYNPNLLWIIVVATLPGILAGMLWEKEAETIFRNLWLIALTLTALGLILFLSDAYFSRKKTIKDLGIKEALIIGLAQAVAIIPGVSRSGATMTAGRFLGLERRDAARFSFLLSTPIILGAAILKIPDLFSHSVNIWPVLVGIFSSAVSGYLAIKYLLKWVEKIGFFPFFVYRLILALTIIILAFFIGS
jgi:undecaprenyl-diphosphatase